MKLKRIINESWAELRESLLEILSKSGIEGLEDAYDTGLLEIGRHPLGDANSFSEQFIIDFVDKLNTSVLSGKTYPIFDKRVADIIRLRNDGNCIENTTIEQVNKRMRHGTLTFDFLNRLPSFDLAKINEIMDIRKELFVPLIKFRSLMLTFSSEINSDVWQDAFLIEVEDKFRQEIEPVLQEIEELCETNKYLKELRGQVLQNWEMPASTLGLTIATVSDFLNVSQACIVGGAKLVYDSAKAYGLYKEKLNEIENHQLYFYYKAGKLTSSLR